MVGGMGGSERGAAELELSHSAVQCRPGLVPATDTAPSADDLLKTPSAKIYVLPLA